MIHILNRIVDLLMARMESQGIFRLNIERGFGSFKERFADSWVSLKISSNFIGEMNLLQKDGSYRTWVCYDSAGMEQLFHWVEHKETLNAEFTVNNYSKKEVSEIFIVCVNSKNFQLMFQKKNTGD